MVKPPPALFLLPVSLPGREPGGNPSASVVSSPTQMAIRKTLYSLSSHRLLRDHSAIPAI